MFQELMLMFANNNIVFLMNTKNTYYKKKILN